MTSASSAGPLSLNVSDDDMDAEKEGQASGSAEDLIMEGDCSAEGDPVWDCRAQINTHFPRGQQMPECTQVFALNVYCAVRRLSSQEQKQLSMSLMGTVGATSVSYVLQVCAALRGFSAARVQRIVERINATTGSLAHLNKRPAVSHTAVSRATASRWAMQQCCTP